MNATASNKIKRRYLCTIKEAFPTSMFALKLRRFDVPAYTVERTVKNAAGVVECREEERFRYRTVDLPLTQRIFADAEDEDGTMQVGQIHELTEEDVAYLWDVEIPRFVVRWEGRYVAPRNNPDKKGVGPGGKYRRGSIHAIKSSEGAPNVRHNPRQNEEPVAAYIIIREISDAELDARAGRHVALEGGREFSERQSAVYRSNEALSEREAELDEREQRLAKREAEIMADAQDDERESLKTSEGKAIQNQQGRRKRGGR